MSEVATQNRHEQFVKLSWRVEDILKKMPGAKVGHEADEELCPLEHFHCDGMYVRKIFMKAGQRIVSKIHKKKHPYFVMSGRCAVFTEQGWQEIKAPYFGITEPGTKRIIAVLENCVWITCHSTDETDLEKIENQIIAKDFNDPALTHSVIKALPSEEV